MAKRSRETSPSSSSDVELIQPEANKYLHVEERPESQDTAPAIRCFLPPHAARPYSFSTYEDYDSHYRKFHANRCSECNKNFPTSHFLDLHIAENHDSLAEARRARGDKTYGCFVEDCDKICFSPQRRRLHLVDKHGFPKNYNFFIVNDGLDRRNSMLRPSRSSRPRQQQIAPSAQQSMQSVALSSPSKSSATADDADPSESEEEGSPSQSLDMASSQSSTIDNTATPTSSSADNSVDALTKSMSSLKFVPPSVRFGRGRGRGFSRR